MITMQEVLRRNSNLQAELVEVRAKCARLEQDRDDWIERHRVMTEAAHEQVEQKKELQRQLDRV